MPDKPNQIQQPDFEKLKKLVDDYIEFVTSNEYYEDNDYKHYIYEEVMTTLYGEEIWKFINNRQPR